jgi:hypothetical protein
MASRFCARGFGRVVRHLASGLAEVIIITTVAFYQSPMNRFLPSKTPIFHSR